MTFKRFLIATTRFSLVGVLSAGAACASALAILSTSVEPHIGGVDLMLPGAGLGLGSLATWLIAVAVGRPRWRAVQWATLALMAGLVAEAVWLWRSLDWKAWLGAGLLFVMTGSFQDIARQLALGWIVDSTGERQKVTSTNRGRAIFTPTTWSQRIIDEDAQKVVRRTQLLWSTLVGFPSAYACYRLWPIKNDWTLFLLFWAGLFALCAFLVWLPTVIDCVRFSLGDQLIKGAKVLDPEPRRPGIEEVADQHVHGDANFASAAEAAALLG